MLVASFTSTGDEMRVHHYAAHIKKQNLMQKHPSKSTPTKFKSVKSAGEVLMVLWDAQVVIYHGYLVKGETVTTILYKYTIIKLHMII